MSDKRTMRTDPDLAELHDMARDLTADATLAQGPRGTLSVKIGDTLWVTASGQWLAHAAVQDIFLPLDLACLQSSLTTRTPDALDKAVIADRARSGLRPSPDTALHALLPHRFVAHLPAINTSTHAILADGRDRVAAALSDTIDWTWIDYARPGPALADAVAERLRAGPVDAIILQNGGLIVGAKTHTEAISLIRTIEERLPLPLRPLADGASPAIDTPGCSWLAAWSEIAMDAELAPALGMGTLFPDQVPFLGGPVPICTPGETLDQVSARVTAACGVAPILILIPGQGACAAVNRSASGDTMMAWLAAVARRIPSASTLIYVPETETAHLIDRVVKTPQYQFSKA